MSRSIQTTANNSASTQITEVGTNTGFSAGDLVYYNNGDYKPASSLTLPSTASFSLTADMPAVQTGSGFGGFAMTFNSTGGTTNIGASGGKASAVLTNGNIVQVFISVGNGQPFFQIVNSSYVSQVSATSVSGTYTNTSYSNVGVLALTGGGFVVYWVNSAGGTNFSMNYAVYTNTGSVTTAATQDTSFSLGNSYVQINGVGLANGTFVLSAVASGGPNVVFRGYSATGVGAYSLVTLSPTVQNNQYWVGLAARSDSSFILVWPSSGPLVNYSLYSAAGSNITSGNISLTNTNYACDVTTLADGTTFVLGYVNYVSSTWTPCFRLLPTGNVLGSQQTIPAANINGGGCSSNATCISLLGLSNGNFIYTFGDAGSSSYAGLNYAIFNSTGTSVTATNSTGTVPLTMSSIALNNYSYVHLLETSSAILMHWISNSKTNAIAYASYYGAFSKTTYLPTSATTVSSSIGSATAACSGVGYANTVPTAIASAAASTGTALVSTSPAYVLQPTLLYGATAVQALATATFSDGRFIIAYRVTGTYVTYASIFTAAGTLIQTITVATSTNASYGVSVAVLTSGKFVVSYINSGGNGSNALYSSSYTLIATTTFSVYTGANYNINVAGLSNDRFVVSYNNGQQYYAVYDSSNTLIAGPTSVLGANCYQNGVCANNWGGFYITFYYPGSGSTYIYSFVNTTGTTYTNYNNYSFGTSMYMCNARPVFSNGWVYSPVGYSGSTTPMIQISDDIATTGNYSSSMSGLDTQSYANMAIGVTGLGNPVVFYPSSGSPNTALFAYTNRTPNNWSSPIVFPNSGKFSMSGATFRGNTGYGSIPSVTSGVGNNVVVAWCNTDGYLYYAIVNMAPYSATLSTVAGVTSSAQIPVSPTAATSSTAIGATFVGVAAATVAAGSAGPVVTNGPAKLNASYTNTASGAFDHSGTPTGGVRGTYSGKIINMQGNT